MNSIQEAACRKIIRIAAVASASGNWIPIPGMGTAIDMTATLSMVVALAGVFDIELGLSEDIPMITAVSAIKSQILRHPVKYAAKETVRFLPILGSVISSGLSAIITEKVGWQIARNFDIQSRRGL